MKTYNKIHVRSSKLQIGVNQDGQVFLRFSEGNNVNDIVLGTEEALAGLHSVLGQYIEESASENRGLFH